METKLTLLFSTLLSLPPFLLSFNTQRESIEACVVVALLLNMCTRLKLTRMRKQVWWGAISGILVSVLLGIVFVAVFYLTKSKVMTGASKAIFKGYINLVAVLLITMLSFAMLRFMNYEKKWAAKLEAAAAKIDVGRANQWSIFFLAFTAVFREGIESVIFLAGVSTTTSWTAIPLAGIVGVLIGLAVGFALYYTGRQIKDIAWFFVLSCSLLFFIAAGLTSLAMVREKENEEAAWKELCLRLCLVLFRGERGEREREKLGDEETKNSRFLSPNRFLPPPPSPTQTSNQQVSWQSIGWFGTWDPPTDRPWWNRAVWDTSGCCPTSNQFFALMTAMFGYLPKPTFISLFSYFGYWAIVLLCIGVKLCRGTLTDATKGKGGAAAADEEGAAAEEGGKGAKGKGAGDGNSANEGCSSSGGSAQDPSEAPYLLPVAHKHLPHLGGKEPPKAAGATDVETGAAASDREPKKWWQRGKKE